MNHKTCTICLLLFLAAAAAPTTQPQANDAWPFTPDQASQRQSAAAQSLGISTQTTLDLGDNVKLQLILIPAGQFTMGTKESLTVEHWKDESQHQVILTKAYYLGLYPVTQAQWKEVMGTTIPQQIQKKTGTLPTTIPATDPATDPAAATQPFGYPKGWDATPVGVGDDYPMYLISWDEATEFCRRVSAETHHAVHLPTESQWEFAASAGSPDRFFFGPDAKQLDQYAWYKSNAGYSTHPVGQLKPNPFGLFDIQGNVWVWCIDWYGNYPPGPVTDPTGPARGDGHMCRGGCWISGWGGCRAADRFRLPADTRRNYVGMRVEMEVDAPATRP